MDHFQINKDMWNQKTQFHVGSEFYGMEAFLQGETTLKEPELKLLGDLKGLSVLHLQCHFGQDTISMSRMGASTVGVDFSDEAIKHANELATKLDVDARFICCNVYDLAQHLEQQFDIVFTSYGTIGWLPDLSKWADIVHRFLKPGGRFIFAEFHPVVWMFDNGFSKVEYNYFKSDPIVETESGTYADKEAPIKTTSVSWNHALTEVFSALMEKGLQLNSFKEYDYSPYNCFHNMEETEPGKFIIKNVGQKLPMMYTLEMKK